MKCNHVRLTSRGGERRFAVACLVAGVCCVGFFAGATQAELVAPNIHAGPLRLAFDPNSESSYNLEAREVRGMQMTLLSEVGGEPEPVLTSLFRDFWLRANVDGDGVLQAGGTLEITERAGRVWQRRTLLTGDLTRLITDGTGETLEFLFDVTGGAVASLYEGMTGKVSLHTTQFPGSFSEYFEDSTATADVGVVVSHHPEPSAAAIWCVLGGLGIYVGWRRKRKAA